MVYFLMFKKFYHKAIYLLSIQSLNCNLSLGQILWLTCIVVPLLSVSLVGGPTDPEVMQKPTGKNQCSITSEVS